MCLCSRIQIHISTNGRFLNSPNKKLFEPLSSALKIILNPNGESRARGGYVSIYLVCVDSMSFAPHKKVYVTCLFRLINKLPGYFKIGRGWFTSSVSAWRFDEFIAIGDMRDPSKGFVVDDSCHFEIKLSVLLAQHEALQLE